jgi:magnesium-transporting ATPase (P-type)
LLGEVNGELVFQPIDDQVRADYDKVQEILSSFGERVLGMPFFFFFSSVYFVMRSHCTGFAQLELDPVQFPEDFQFQTTVVNFPVEGLTFCGLISLIDPPKLSVPESIARCHVRFSFTHCFF